MNKVKIISGSEAWEYYQATEVVYCYTVALMDAGRPPRDNVYRKPWYGWRERYK